MLQSRVAFDKEGSARETIQRIAARAVKETLASICLTCIGVAQLQYTNLISSHSLCCWSWWGDLNWWGSTDHPFSTDVNKSNRCHISRYADPVEIRRFAADESEDRSGSVKSGYKRSNWLYCRQGWLTSLSYSVGL